MWSGPSSASSGVRRRPPGSHGVGDVPGQDAAGVGARGLGVEPHGHGAVPDQRVAAQPHAVRLREGQVGVRGAEVGGVRRGGHAVPLHLVFGGDDVAVARHRVPVGGQLVEQPTFLADLKQAVERLGRG